MKEEITIFFNKDIVITIEAKADETLGNLVEEEIKNAENRKKNRNFGLIQFALCLNESF